MKYTPYMFNMSKNINPRFKRQIRLDMLNFFFFQEIENKKSTGCQLCTIWVFAR